MWHASSTHKSRSLVLLEMLYTHMAVEDALVAWLQ